METLTRQERREMARLSRKARKRLSELKLDNIKPHKSSMDMKYESY